LGRVHIYGVIGDARDKCEPVPNYLDFQPRGIEKFLDNLSNLFYYLYHTGGRYSLKRIKSMVLRNVKLWQHAIVDCAHKFKRQRIFKDTGYGYSYKQRILQRLQLLHRVLSKEGLRDF